MFPSMFDPPTCAPHLYQHYDPRWVFFFSRNPPPHWPNLGMPWSALLRALVSRATFDARGLPMSALSRPGASERSDSALVIATPCRRDAWTLFGPGYSTWDLGNPTWCINPSYPTYNWAYNLLMIHQVGIPVQFKTLIHWVRIRTYKQSGYVLVFFVLGP